MAATASVSGKKQVLRGLVQTLAVGGLFWAILAGLGSTIPFMPLNEQSSRNLFYHVPLWFAMMGMLYASVVYSIRFLRNPDPDLDLKAEVSAGVGLLFGLLGLITGIIWSRVTWAAAISDDTDLAAWWTWDPKQTMALIGLLIYLGYFILRRSFDEPMQRAKVSAVFNVFAAATLAPLFYIVPRFLESNHPNTSGQKDAISTMGREFAFVFWPAVIGTICLSIWIMDLQVRAGRAARELNELES